MSVPEKLPEAGEVQGAIDRLTLLREKWLVDKGNRLFATLAATIEPQLAILESAVGGNHDDPATVACAHVLADAINGAK